jgi:DNA-directed RNA polymerase subunit RPC12/RpoP
MRTWMSKFRCFKCAKEFLVDRLSLAEIQAAKAIIPCPHCFEHPSETTPHRMIDLSAANLPYRRKKDGQTWHYSEYCSHWPLADFIEIEFAPAGDICNECKVLVGS